jgi:hypothetical protein
MATPTATPTNLEQIKKENTEVAKRVQNFKEGSINHSVIDYVPEPEFYDVDGLKYRVAPKNIYLKMAQKLLYFLYAHSEYTPDWMLSIEVFRDFKIRLCAAVDQFTKFTIERGETFKNIPGMYQLSETIKIFEAYSINCMDIPDFHIYLGCLNSELTRVGFTL